MKESGRGIALAGIVISASWLEINGVDATPIWIASGIGFAVVFWKVQL